MHYYSKRGAMGKLSNKLDLNVYFSFYGLSLVESLTLLGLLGNETTNQFIV